MQFFSLPCARILPLPQPRSPLIVPQWLFNSVTTLLQQPRQLQLFCWRELGNGVWTRALVRGSTCPTKATLELIKFLRPVVLGIAPVDFNHIVGPKIEFHEGEIFEGGGIAKILPLLALPDGAHLVIDPVIANSRYPYSECSTQVLFRLVF